MALTPDDNGEGVASGESVFDGLKDNTLKKAGYAYLLGDASLFASGMMAGRYKEASTGLWWALGGLICAKYANPDAEKQLKLLSGRLSNYLQQQGVEIPPGPTTEILNRKEGVIDHIEAFFHQYPSQILNATYAVGAAQLIRSGLQHGKKWDAASGALVAAGALAGLLVPEQKPDPDQPAIGAFNKAKAWIQEKPLRLPGILYALNNITLVTSAFREWRTNPAQKSYMFKALTAASYIFGNTMLSLSSKNDHGNGDAGREAMEKLADVSTHVIASQPPEIREALVHNIAAFLSSQSDVHMTAEEISGMLNQKLQESGMQSPAGWLRWVYNPGTPVSPQL